MIPWPIALIAAFYGVVFAWSSAALWRAGAAPASASIGWAGWWSAGSFVLMVGLVFLKPWARRLAVWSSGLLLLSSLGAALLAVAQPVPDARHSLLATGLAALQLVLIRYLTRPHVKRWFAKEPHGAHLLR